jgi:lipoyl(octanoyl) transferase
MVEWLRAPTLVEYPAAVSFMEARAEAAARGAAEELVWLLEHPPLYTAGTSARAVELLDVGRFPVYDSGRGGHYTYHGPGQRVGYTVLNLKSRFAPAVPDLRAFVRMLEEWLSLTLGEFGVRGERRAGRIGIWVDTPAGEKKIAALGVRVRRGVSLHGVALNICPDLSHFSGIIPCGITEYGVTSLADLGVRCSMEEVDAALRRYFSGAFEGMPARQ